MQPRRHRLGSTLRVARRRDRVDLDQLLEDVERQLLMRRQGLSV